MAIDPVTGSVIAGAASSFLGSLFGGGDGGATKQRKKEFEFAQNLERLQQQRQEDALLRTRVNQNTLNPVRRDLLVALASRLGIKISPEDLLGVTGAAKAPNLPVVK